MINVMYVSDDNYAEIMGVSILSMLESNPNEKFHIYVVDDGISENHIDRLHRMITEKNALVTFLDKPDVQSAFGIDIYTARWPLNVYYRLFLGELFADFPEVKKILYVDCDTLFVAPIRELWDTDLSDVLGTACLDFISNPHKRLIGQRKEDSYFNAGIFLLNIGLWIQDDIETSLIDYVKKRKGHPEYNDQGVLNAIISRRLKILHPRYNVITLYFDFTYKEIEIFRKASVGYSKAKLREAAEQPVIAHFTNSFLSLRPWFEGSTHPYAKRWKEVHDRTPWKDEPYRILKNRKRKDWIIRVYHTLPRWLAVRIAGFLHAYVKPLVFLTR